MEEKIGKIKKNVQDKRSGRLIFLSHCILNQNACVRGLAGQPAVIRELVDLLLVNDIAMYQMPCPEVTHIGSMRWGQVKKQYGSPMFKRHCRKIAADMCDQIQTYRDNDHEVVGLVLRDGSPTCGLNSAAVEADEMQVWGGMVWHASPLQKFGNTSGVYSEELIAEIESRKGFEVPLFALPEVEEAGCFEEALLKIKQAIENK